MADRWEAGVTLTISVMIGRREGGFVMAPEARLDDGWFDLVQAGKLTRWEGRFWLIPRLSTDGPAAGASQAASSSVAAIC